jgi:DHA1 family bicyclomycin/chloramphenicol resistance-like MFS transporter
MPHRISVFKATTFSMLSTILDMVGPMMFLPAVPALAIVLGLKIDTVQLSLPLFVLGVTLSQFFAGYAADLWCRRNVILILLACYVAGCALSFMAHSGSAFFTGILLQGIGVGGTFSNCQALVAEACGKGSKTSKHLGIIFVLTVFLEGAGGAVGGALVHSFGWRSTFLVLGLLGAIMFVSFFGLPKNKRAHQKNLSFSQLLHDYAHVYWNNIYLRYVLALALLYSGFFVFFTLSPFMYIHYWHFTPREYGLAIFGPITGMFIGSVLAIFLAPRISKKNLILAGCFIATLGAFLMVALLHSKINGPYTLLFCMGIYCVGAGLAAPSLRSAAIHTAMGLVATASALVSVTVNAVSALCTTLTSHTGHFNLSKILLALMLINLVQYSFFTFKKFTFKT